MKYLLNQERKVRIEEVVLSTIASICIGNKYELPFPEFKRRNL